MVGHLIEADNDEAELMHPCATENGEGFERDLASAAHIAGGSLLTEGQRRWAAEQHLQLAPVASHIEAVQMLGVARLTYRPRTKATAAWVARKQEWESFRRRYQKLARDSIERQLERANLKAVV
jgi:hypothetical protein